MVKKQTDSSSGASFRDELAVWNTLKHPS